MSGAELIAGVVEWGVAAHAYPGERVCGDAHLVVAFDGGVLAAVIDGLGHGEEAAQASRLAVASLAGSAGKPLMDAVRICHDDLRRTRGAALSVAAINRRADRVSWLGVGNVEAVMFGAAGRQSMVPRAGVVGYQLPPMREASFAIRSGDVLMLATDGVSPRFCERAPLAPDPPAMAREVLDAWGRANDDSLVLAMRYLGGQA